MNGKIPVINRFAHGRFIHFAALAWGFAEATVFFIVPDVLLSAIGCRTIRDGCKAVGYVLLGSLAGGVIMYGAGRFAPDSSRSFLSRVPAIQPHLIEQVADQLSQHGVTSVLIGPTRGVPYKIYAVEWGARCGSLFDFLLISIPARVSRFFISVLLSAGIARLLASWTKRRTQIELSVLGVFWTGFYLFYFCSFGW